MLSAFRYRIYPNSEQEMRLKRSLLLLCNLYNGLRAKKIREYKQRGISLTRSGLRSLALEERRRDMGLQSVHSQVVQNAADRLHTAFVNCFEGRARFPKNKQQRKYCSLTYPQSGFKMQDGRLFLSKIGRVRIFLHRAIQGTIQRLTIKYEAGEWYAIFVAERQPSRKHSIDRIPNGRIRGVDVGLASFATLDNADSIEYPKFLRQSEEKVKQLQKRLANKQKGSKRWKRICFSLARVHQHVKRQREDFQNKLVATLFREIDVLVLEKLNVEGMLQNRDLAKSISDASFGKFARKATFKAEILGKRLVAVDPWGTTQFCYRCLGWVPKDLSEREHNCPRCGETLQRDHNSAKLIRRLGIIATRSGPPPDGGLSFAEPRPLPSLRRMASRGVEAGSQRL